MLTLATRLLTIVVLLALPLAASAQPKELSRKDRNKVETLVRKAERAKRAGDRFAATAKTRERGMTRYKSAAVDYLEAYRINEAPALLFQLAAIYDARGEKAWALRGYKRYLEVEPTGAHKPVAEERIALLQDDAAAGEQSPGDTEIDPTELFGEEIIPEPEPVPGPEAEPETPKPQEIEAKTDTKLHPNAGSGRVLRYSGIGTAVLGTLAVGLGIKYGLDASSASDKLSNKEGTWTEADRALILRGEEDETSALVFSLAGVAGILGGGVLYYMGSKSGAERNEKASAAIVPLLTDEGMTLTWMGRY